MNSSYLRTCLVAFIIGLTPIGFGQVLYPYNPDGNADNLISVVDLFDLLSTYGSEFQVENEATIDGTPLSQILEQSVFSGDTIWIESGSLKLTNIVTWNGTYTGNNCGEVLFPDEHTVPEGKAWKVVYYPDVLIRINGTEIATSGYRQVNGTVSITTSRQTNTEIWMTQGDIMTFSKPNSGCCPTNCPYTYNLFYSVEEYTIP